MTSWYFVLDPSTVVKVQELPPVLEDFFFHMPIYAHRYVDGVDWERYNEAFAKYEDNARSLPPLVYIGKEPLTKQVYEMGEMVEGWQVREKPDVEWKMVDFFTYVLCKDHTQEFETRQVVTLK